MAAPAYLTGYPIAGVDKHTGRHASYFSMQVGATIKNFSAWSRISHSGGMEFVDNTMAGSSLSSVQPNRLEAPQFEIEVRLPYNEDGPNGARAVINFLRAGRIMDGFNVGAPVGEEGGTFSWEYLASFGKWIIERSSIEISKDDLTSVRATVRALGYTNVQNLPIRPPIAATGGVTPTPAP